MGGRIGVDSTPGAGATFHFMIPLPQSGAVAASFAAPDLSDADVLLVAPTAIAASLLGRRLRRWGARSALAPDADAAAALASERAWSTVFVDHALGADACRRLAQATAAIARRIVLITPADRHALPALKAAGFTGYLVKPVRAASLAARMTAGHDGFEHAVQDVEQRADAPIEAKPHRLAILVAEDNEINALLAKSLLERLGHRPTMATTGDAAVEAWLAAQAADAPYDLLLMDLHMPGSDGVAATRRIRALETERGAWRTPIIALTANALEEDRESCLSAGMDGFLTKPLDRERLAAALATAAGKALAA
jgi:CheY-like chemotaxis protein